MSADNGIYILPSPTENGLEYRVAHCQAVENVDWHPLYEVILFSHSPIYTSEKEAVLAAFEQSKEYEILEYGVSTLEARKHPFSKKSYEEAYKELFRVDYKP